jgi:hypothetical protein
VKGQIKPTLSLGDFLVIAVAIVAAVFAAEFFPLRGVVAEVIPPAEPPQPRPLSCTDWEPRDHGGGLSCIYGEDGNYLKLGPAWPWEGMKLRSGVLPEMEDYRWLEMEVWVPPSTDYKGWLNAVYVSYENLEFREFQIVADDAEIGYDLLGETLVYVLEGGDWRTIRIPIRTDEFGEVRMITITSFGGFSLRIRNVTLIP